MSYSKFVKAFTSVAIFGVVGLLTLGGCNSGDTDGGTSEDELGPGNVPVSDGGFGASLTISLDDGGDTLQTGARKRFFVTALDPSGIPLGFRRVFCDSELGIAILEPSSGGVAFEHTNAEGVMSGVLGGALPGSYLLECRLEEGFNLVARRTLRVQGDIPPGFAGFPGAAGGNLGGGVIPPNTNVALVGIDLGSPIDIQRQNCGGGATDLEPFSIDNYQLTIQNAGPTAVRIESVTFSIPSLGVESTEQFSNVTVEPGGQETITGPFTEFVINSSQKVFAGTSIPPSIGTYNVTFEVNGETVDGTNVGFDGSTTVVFAQVDNC